jgi:3',5'-nucleoside bisphosphate phosphatase
MNEYRADLHIHTVLSPCADLEMTPANIVNKARESGLQIIGITDHNSTKNALLVKRLAKNEGIFVLTGAEVTTKEEVHCLAFFEFEEQLMQFQQFLDNQITIIPNPEGHFGYQPVVDANDNILELIPNYLPAALKKGISDVQKMVESLDGIFIPAHVDRPVNGIFSQLGFIPPGLKFDAMGISKWNSEKDVRKHYVLGKEITLIRNSDAHYLQQIGEIYTLFHLEEICFSEIKMALNQQNNRFVKIQ